MPRVSISNLDSYVEECLAKVRKGAGDFAKDSGQGVRLGPVSFACEVVFDDAEIIEARDTATQDSGTVRTTTTESPFSQTEVSTKAGTVTQDNDSVLVTTTDLPISNGATNAGERVVTTKTGSYTQSGTQSTAQGGGSLDVEKWEYDETT